MTFQELILQQLSAAADEADCKLVVTKSFANMGVGAVIPNGSVVAIATMAFNFQTSRGTVRLFEQGFEPIGAVGFDPPGTVHSAYGGYHDGAIWSALIEAFKKLLRAQLDKARQ